MKNLWGTKIFWSFHGYTGDLCTLTYKNIHKMYTLQIHPEYTSEGKKKTYLTQI